MYCEIQLLISFLQSLSCTFIQYNFSFINLLYKLCINKSNTIPCDDFSHQAFGGVLNPKFFGHQVVGVECVDGELYENRTRSSRLCDGQGLPDRRHDLSDGPDGGTELTQRLEQRHLVDILQRPSAL